MSPEEKLVLIKTHCQDAIRFDPDHADLAAAILAIIN